MKKEILPLLFCLLPLYSPAQDVWDNVIDTTLNSHLFSGTDLPTVQLKFWYKKLKLLAKDEEGVLKYVREWRVDSIVYNYSIFLYNAKGIISIQEVEVSFDKRYDFVSTKYTYVSLKTHLHVLEGEIQVGFNNPLVKLTPDLISDFVLNPNFVLPPKN